jgi:hypothetical protein
MKRHIWQLTEISISIMPFHWALEIYHDCQYFQLAFGPLRFSIGWPIVTGAEVIK